MGESSTLEGANAEPSNRSLPVSSRSADSSSRSEGEAGAVFEAGLRLLRSAYHTARSAANVVANRFDPPILVLMYHSVTSLESDPHMLSVSPANFRAQMELLKQCFPVLRFEDEWSDRDTPAVVVTFDDGYANNFLEALPILEDVGVPATFFLSTEAIETGRGFWWDEVDALVFGQGDLPGSFELVDGESTRCWCTDTAEERRIFHWDLIGLMKMLDCGPRQERLAQLRDWAGSDPPLHPKHRPMTIEEVAALAESPMASVGAHGITHTALSAISRQRQDEELAGSKRKLEHWLGREVSVFAYPYGGRIYYTREAMQLCRAAGFRKAAAATFAGQVHRWTHPFEIPRQMVVDWSADELADKLPALFTA